MQWSAGVPPTSGQDVWITNSFAGNQTITFDSGAALTYTSLNVDATGGGTNVFWMPGNFLTSPKEMVAISGSAAFNQDSGTNTLAGGTGLQIGVNAGSSGAYSLANDAVLLATNSYEYVGVSGVGNFSQTGGTNMLVGSNTYLRLGESPGSTGTYTLGGSASLIANSASEYIGSYGLGIFNQTGGSNVLINNGALRLGNNTGSATYFLGAGSSLSASNSGEYIGSGTFHQTGGTNSLTGGYLDLDASGPASTYTLSGGSLVANNQTREYLGFFGVANFNQTGGIHLLTGQSSLSLGEGYYGTGNYTLNSDATLGASNSYEYVGASGLGNFNQDGGVNSLTGGMLEVGASGPVSSSGMYNLEYGNLIVSSASELIAYYGHGVFNQTGGTNSLTSSTLNIGNQAGLTYTGTYTLGTGGSLIGIDSNEYVGSGGLGYFNQSGGTNSLTGASTLYVGDNAGSTGFYSRSGGLLCVPNIYIGGKSTVPGGTGSFAVSGGQLNVSGTLQVWNTPGSGLSIQGGNVTAASTINPAAMPQTGGTANLGALSGGGTLSIGNPSGTAANMTLASLQQSSVLIDSTGLLTLNGGSVSNAVKSLQINSGGNLVINGNHNVLTLNYGYSASPKATIGKYLQNGYNNGFWDAGGTLPNPAFGSITSATAAGNSAYSIGYADGRDAVVAGLGGGQIAIKFTFAGDANLDGQVDLSDLIILASHFGSTGAGWDQGDFSYDSSVNLTDLTILANHFGDGTGNPLEDTEVHSQFSEDLVILESSNPAFADGVNQLVPEPGSLALLAMVSMGVLRRIKNR
jgi:hypothetical protein